MAHGPQQPTNGQGGLRSAFAAARREVLAPTTDADDPIRPQQAQADRMLVEGFGDGSRLTPRPLTNPIAQRAAVDSAHVASADAVLRELEEESRQVPTPVQTEHPAKPDELLAQGVMMSASVLTDLMIVAESIPQSVGEIVTELQSNAPAATPQPTPQPMPMAPQTAPQRDLALLQHLQAADDQDQDQDIAF